MISYFVKLRNNFIKINKINKNHYPIFNKDLSKIYQRYSINFELIISKIFIVDINTIDKIFDW